MIIENQPTEVGPAKPAAMVVSTWMGRPMTDLTREELLEVVEWCEREIQSLRSDRDRWRESGDAIKYMMMSGRPGCA